MAASSNQLLSSLSSADFDLLEPHLEPVTLGLRKQLEKPDKPITIVYFPQTGFASVVAVQGKDKMVEVGLIGREGMSGLPIVLGTSRSPHSTYIQASGEGKCIRSSDLRKAIGASESMQGLFLKYAHAFGIQTAQTAICNARSRLDQRLARWLLMAHDRVGSNRLPLTHEFLSLMLGVRRAGVTEAVHVLESGGLIEWQRGHVIVRDRKGIERIAAESYGVPEAEYRRLIPRTH